MNKAKASFLAGLLAVTVMVSGCAKQGALGGGEKVATVNGTPITKTEYDKTYNEFQKAFQLESVPPQQKTMLEDTLKQMTINKLVLQTLIDNEAKKSGIKVTDAEVEKYKEEKIFKNPALKEQFKTFLAQNKMQESDFDAMLKDNLLLNKFMEVKGGDAVKVTDAEVKAFYNKNTDQFKVPERIHASHILVKAIVPQMKQDLRDKNPKITEDEINKKIAEEKTELKAKADKLYKEVKANPAKFDELAKKESDDAMSAKQGGDLGYMAESNIDPAFWAAAEKTPDGKLHEGVVSTQFGYHILKVLDHQAPHQQTFAEAKDNIREGMSQEKKQAFLQKWAEQQKTTAKIVIEPKYQAKEAPEAAAQAQSAAGPHAAAPAEATPEKAASAGKH